MDLTTLKNRQIRLAQRPVGLPGAECWQLTEEAVQAPAEGGVLLQTLALSLDPAMRGWMNEGKSYIPPVGIGEVMRAGGIGRVIASANAAFPVGELGQRRPRRAGLLPGARLTKIKRTGLVTASTRAWAR